MDDMGPSIPAHDMFGVGTAGCLRLHCVTIFETMAKSRESLGRLKLGKAIEKHEDYRGTDAAPARDWRKGMSDNIAYALIVYTGLQIVFSVSALKQGSSSILPVLVLIVLIAAIIPACRWAEARWKDLSAEEAETRAQNGEYRRDQILLWIAAVGLPLVITAGIKGLFAAFG